MLPENKLSSHPVLDGKYAVFVNPERHSWLMDFERGGEDIQNNSGLDTLWHSEYDKKTGAIVLKNNNVSRPVLNVENVTELAFAFDLNMQPAVSYVTNDKVYLYWYDTAAGGFVTTFIGERIINPRLTLDDRRTRQSGNADVIFAYINEGALCVRFQRERYTIEHMLSTIGSDKILWHVSMMKNYRVGFMFKD